MKQLILAIALAAALGNAHAEQNAPSLSKVNGSLTAEAGKAYGDLDTVNGSITVEEKAAARDVETVNGSIVVDVQARADGISTVNGKIVLRNGVQAESVETVNGSIVGVSNLRVAKDVEAVNGSIEIGAGSQVGGTVATVNGGIKLLAMKVAGGLETVNGDILVGDGTEVAGGILVSKPKGWGINWGKRKVPRIVLGANSVVHGELVFEREVELFVHSSAKYGRIRYMESDKDKAGTLKPTVFTGKRPD